MRSWAPRRPSAKLKRRLFAIRLAAAAPPAHSWSWLAPATAALLVTGMLFNQRHCATLFEAGHSGPLVAMILTNPSAAACLPAGFESEQNGWPADAFHHPNASQAISAPGPRLVAWPH